ncbi:Endoplasmic reticulum vesicle protein 25 [Grifola frondosa]|uniref:Endoplasmic reticulum vesicle protein 25 n=1 Tax=Grifola frondosa TaxID=5627 RepID=A0A1C7LSW6_GRIFR|nr:Endoplasmic reticulum vesicle protein 25 [Grifola frondosa]
MSSRRRSRFTPSLPLLYSAHRYPPAKCIWNAAHPGALVIVTANVGPGDGQRIDLEIIDSSSHKNVYLSKKDVNGEKRFAITAHAEEDIGVCFRNYLDPGVAVEAKPRSRVIDLDVDIGADAVDYNAIANQESLSALETEMRKLEGVVKEIVDEMEYLKKREERFQSTNSTLHEFDIVIIQKHDFARPDPISLIYDFIPQESNRTFYDRAACTSA